MNDNSSKEVSLFTVNSYGKFLTHGMRPQVLSDNLEGRRGKNCPTLIVTSGIINDSKSTTDICLPWIPY